jgi:hypothetical protein
MVVRLSAINTTSNMPVIFVEWLPKAIYATGSLSVVQLWENSVWICWMAVYKNRDGEVTLYITHFTVNCLSLCYITMYSLDPKLVKMAVGCGICHINTKT